MRNRNDFTETGGVKATAYGPTERTKSPDLAVIHQIDRGYSPITKIQKQEMCDVIVRNIDAHQMSALKDFKEMTR